MEVVPDDFALIEDRLHHFVDEELRPDLHHGRDRLDARRHHARGDARVIDREAPGLAEAMRAEAARHTPMGILTRGVAGIAEADADRQLPRLPKAIDELFPVLAPGARATPCATLRGDSRHGARHGG